MPGAEHTEIRDKLREVGRLEGFPASDTEYAINGEFLDTVWKKTLESVPKFAFEVSVGGDLRRALAKLRRAWILWNSQVRLVTTEDQETTAIWLLDGTYPEMVKDARIVTCNLVRELYVVLSNRQPFRERLGYWE